MIALSPGLYLRAAGTNTAHVQVLSDVAESAGLPPILVQRNGFRVIDGMHRVAAAKLRRQDRITARVVDCTDAEALVLAIRANTLHGLPLSRQDRLHGAKRILSLHPGWSDRAVAAAAGISPRSVATIRGRQADGDLAPGKRLGRDGKLHPANRIDGRRRAADYIEAHPDATIRQVARETGVSVGTVHSVRSRLRLGGNIVGQRPNGIEARTDQDAAPPAGCAAGAAPGDAVTAGGGRSRPRPRHAAWREIAAKLAGDPTIRYTDDGRAFMRWLARRAADPGEWREHIDAIPDRWLADIALLAEAISADWHRFAQCLRNG